MNGVVCAHTYLGVRARTVPSASVHGFVLRVLGFACLGRSWGGAGVVRGVSACQGIRLRVAKQSLAVWAH